MGDLIEDGDEYRLSRDALLRVGFKIARSLSTPASRLSLRLNHASLS